MLCGENTTPPLTLSTPSNMEVTSSFSLTGKLVDGAKIQSNEKQENVMQSAKDTRVGRGFNSQPDNDP